jgi:hypothetical protein
MAFMRSSGAGIAAEAEAARDGWWAVCSSALEGVAAEAATGAANKAAADIAMSWFSLDMVIS